MTKYTDEQRAKFHAHIDNMLIRISQRDEIESKLFDWFLFFIEGDGSSTPENHLQFKLAKMDKLMRMQKRIAKQLFDLDLEVKTLKQIVRNREHTGDYADGTRPKDVPDL